MTPNGGVQRAGTAGLPRMSRFLTQFAGRYLLLAVALAGFWLLMSGFFHKPALIAFGAFSVMATIFFAARADVIDGEGVPTRLFPGLIGYLFWLIFEIGKANLIVAAEVLRPKPRLSPKFVRVPTGQVSDLGTVMFANSITLTPGTVSVDVGRDTILVHAFTEAAADVAGMTAMGRRVRSIDRSPEARD